MKKPRTGLSPPQLLRYYLWKTKANKVKKIALVLPEAIVLVGRAAIKITVQEGVGNPSCLF